MKKKFRMSLATELALTSIILILMIMLLVEVAVRITLTDKFKALYERDVHNIMLNLERELFEERSALNNQLRQIGLSLVEDTKFRLYTAVLRDVQQQYIIDYASESMKQTTLEVLEIIDPNGIVISSGHYRNYYGGNSRSLLNNLRKTDPRVTLTKIQNPARSYISLVSLDSIIIASRKYYVIGGVKITPSFMDKLQAGRSDIVFLRTPDALIGSSGRPVPDEMRKELESDGSQTAFFKSIEEQYSYNKIQIPYFVKDSVKQAEIFILHPKADLQNAIADLDRRFLLITAVGLMIAIVLSFWRANALVAPLRNLSEIASSLSLSKLAANFDVKGGREVEVLNNTMKKMVRRLRRNRIELAKAEHRAALGNLARQVTHDIKNGFVPIKNVMNHWEEVANDQPDELPKVFHERKSTVRESLEYLDYLARNYSRIRHSTNLSNVDINELISSLLENYQDLQENGLHISLELDSGEPRIFADAIQLRRAFDNIIQNALEAIDDKGMIHISTAVEGDVVVVSWQDNGGGIPGEVQKKLFKNYVTTKEHGSGIGLINVKSIVDDIGGTVQLNSVVGQGTTVQFKLAKIQDDKL